MSHASRGAHLADLIDDLADLYLAQAAVDTGPPGVFPRVRRGPELGRGSRRRRPA